MSDPPRTPIEFRIDRTLHGLTNVIEEAAVILSRGDLEGFRSVHADVLNAYVAWLRSLSPLRDRIAWWALNGYVRCRACNGQGAVQKPIVAPAVPRSPLTHELKCDAPWFGLVFDGMKTFELRRNDRDFRSGDLLCLREYDPMTAEYTGRECRRTVIFTMTAEEFGLKRGFVALQLETIRTDRTDPVGATIILGPGVTWEFPRCQQGGCKCTAAFWISWPGTDRMAICLEHAEKARSIADAMGFQITLEPILLKRE
jgi:hypothetical protein